MLQAILTLIYHFQPHSDKLPPHRVVSGDEAVAEMVWLPIYGPRMYIPAHHLRVRLRTRTHQRPRRIQNSAKSMDGRPGPRPKPGAAPGRRRPQTRTRTRQAQSLAFRTFFLRNTPRFCSARRACLPGAFPSPSTSFVAPPALHLRRIGPEFDYLDQLYHAKPLHMSSGPVRPVLRARRNLAIHRVVNNVTYSSSRQRPTPCEGYLI